MAPTRRTLLFGAAALAALMYPLRERLEGKSIGLVVCGANIESSTVTTSPLQTQIRQTLAQFPDLLLGFPF